MNPEAIKKLDPQSRAQYENIERDNKIRALETKAQELVDKLMDLDYDINALVIKNTLATEKNIISNLVFKERNE